VSTDAIVMLKQDHTKVKKLFREFERLQSGAPSRKQAVVNKILHTPTAKLRESRRAGTSDSWLDLVHELFGLERRA